jgi:aminoglycoside 2''-phosphotransferase
MKDLTSKVEHIRGIFPDLDIHQAVLNEAGQYSVILEVDSAWIFRFPRYPQVVTGMKKEVALLDALRSRLPLAIPEPVYVHLEAPAGEAFMGYRCIPGEPLWVAIFQAIQNAEVLDRTADQLGAFLQALHGHTQDDFPGIQLETSDSRAHHQDFYRRIQEKLFPLMRPDARTWVTHHFENHLVDESNFAYKPALRHGDFGTNNLLFDAAQGRLSGVIDFSGAALGDPAVDLAGLMVSYGEGFIERIGRTYPINEAILQRVRYTIGTFALEEALFGYEFGDEAALRAGLANYV